jgi:hypothetical protein
MVKKTGLLPGPFLAWLGAVIFLVIVKIILEAFFPGAFADPAQAALFSWPALGIFSVVGLVGVWISQYTLLREPWERPSSFSGGVLFPFLAGAVLGAVLVGVDLLTNYSGIVAARRGLEQQYTGFLPMLLAFTGGSIIVEVVYRMLILPLLLWLISVVVLRRRFQDPVFWILAVLTSFLEPFTQTPDLQVLPGLTAAIVALVLISLNFTQATFWRRYGFLAAILVRVGFYFVWHVLYIH